MRALVVVVAAIDGCVLAYIYARGPPGSEALRCPGGRRCLAGLRVRGVTPDVGIRSKRHIEIGRTSNDQTDRCLKDDHQIC